MPSGKDQHSGKGKRRLRREGQRTQQPTEHTKREIRRLDQEQRISPELAARLQAQYGNHAVAQLLDLSTAEKLAATASEHRGPGSSQEEEELLETMPDEEVQQDSDKGKVDTATIAGVKGLPNTSGAAVTTADKLLGGNDDDEPLPVPEEAALTGLVFRRRGRGNLALLHALRKQGRLPTETLEEVDRVLSTAAKALSTGGGPSTPRGSAPRGDALFRTPMESWYDPKLMAGRGCSPEDLQGLAGPFDPLGRPIAVGHFAAPLCATPMARSLARLCSSAPGTLMAQRGGLTAAAARLATLASLGMAADGLGGGTVRDRALRIALSDAAMELALQVSGSHAETVPPAHTVYGKATGSAPRGKPPEPPPAPQTARWVGAALRHAGQVAPLPPVAAWIAPPAPTGLPQDDPMSIVDAIIARTTPGDGSLPADRAELRPQLAGIDTLLAAGGRAQLELAAAALASRRPAFDPLIASTLRRAYRGFRDVARRLAALRVQLDNLQGEPLAPNRSQIVRGSRTIGQARQQMDQLRDRALSTLATLCERG